MQIPEFRIAPKKGNAWNPNRGPQRSCHKDSILVFSSGNQHLLHIPGFDCYFDQACSHLPGRLVAAQSRRGSRLLNQSCQVIRTRVLPCIHAHVFLQQLSGIQTAAWSLKAIMIGASHYAIIVAPLFASLASEALHVS